MGSDIKRSAANKPPPLPGPRARSGAPPAPKLPSKPKLKAQPTPAAQPKPAPKPKPKPRSRIKAAPLPKRQPASESGAKSLRRDVPASSAPPSIGLSAPARVEVRASLRPHWLGEVLECFDPKREELLYVVAVDPSIRVPRLRLQRIARDMPSPRGEGLSRRPTLVSLADRRVGLAYPWNDGVSLAELCHGKALAPQRAISVMRQACGLVADLHDEGLAHGALTLDGLILSAGDGKLDTLSVGDYGLRLLFDKHDQFAPSAAADRVPVSPERVLGLGTGPAEDIYALGVLGFALLTGEAPLPGNDAKEAMRRHAIEDPPPLEELMPSHPAAEALGDVIARCMAKEPSDRYASAAAVDRAIAQAFVSEPMASVTTVRERPDFSAEEVELTPSSRIHLDAPRPNTGSVLVVGNVASAPAGPMPHQHAASNASHAHASPRADKVAPAPTTEGRRVYFIAGGAALLLGALLWLGLRGDGTPEPAPKAFASAQAVASANPELSEPESDPESDPVPDPNPESDSVPGPESDSDPVPDPDPDPDPVPEPETVAEPELEFEGGDALHPLLPGARGGSDEPTKNQGTNTKALAKELASKGKRALRSGKTRSAEGYFKRALDANARNLSALSGLRSLYFNRGDYVAAVRYAQRAAKVAPRSASVQLALGDAYFRAAQRGDAKRAYLRAKELGSASAQKRLAKF